MALTNSMETCQLPINILDVNYQSFIKNILPKLLDKNIGVLAMKTLAGGGFFGGGFEGIYGEEEKVIDHVSLSDALHFVWSFPVDVLITGPDNAEMLQEKIDIAKSFTRLNEEEREKLINKVAHMAGTHVEYYKS
jgi:predicted aldo/keto reductase-like oxidoreductase